MSSFVRIEQKNPTFGFEATYKRRNFTLAEVESIQQTNLSQTTFDINSICGGEDYCEDPIYYPKR